jgi:hypothetical protein
VASIATGPRTLHQALRVLLEQTIEHARLLQARLHSLARGSHATVLMRTEPPTCTRTISVRKRAMMRVWAMRRHRKENVFALAPVPWIGIGLREPKQRVLEARSRAAAGEGRHSA